VDSVKKIIVEVDLGRKGVEKTEIYVYLDGRLIETHFDKTYEHIRVVAEDLKARYKHAEVEVICEGEDFFGRIHKWPLEI